MTVLSRAFADRRTAVVIGGIALACLLRAICPSEACEIPVYQYALENWEADEYEVIVFHRGELSPAQRDDVGLLQRASIHGGGHGNLLVKAVDLATNRDAILLQRWREQSTERLPRVVAYYPNARRIPEPVWAGPLSAEEIRALVDSPLRRTIAGELASRVTASWLLLESGNRGRDNAAAALLERELRRLEETLVLPALEGWGGADVEPPPVRFTLHRLGRDTASEQVLVNTLLHSESDLATKYRGEPMAFPIYGRGLILYALVGAGINEWTITKAAEFVTGPCSCEVKAGNPGTDILMGLDWNRQVKQTAVERMPPPVGMASFQDRAAEAERRLAEVDEAHDRAGDAAATGVAHAPAAQPQVGGASATAPRATPPRGLQTAGPSAPSSETSRSGGDENAQASPGESAGPPAPVSGAADGAAPTEDTPTEEPLAMPELGDGAADRAALSPADSDSDGRGAARLVGLLGLIAAAITTALTSAVIRRRRQAARDEEHERVPT